ncbi:uncharacterized protein N7511_007808 [Penicillium nucicola]|uniref:uncharacterized protein n=1 Tax=Penicillium nucicola TaxID=1850975 RepID=UPI002545A2A1|nr:uncharacterized protein N7511_007808 [Penicillium nucicola]KAJ5753655.1 hypothetical protein N7511_007808 [Penicillium nucicola]
MLDRLSLRFLHNLSRDASIRYASGSIEVVLGYQPHEVLDRSCWEYFHPQELPFARSIHGRGVRLDKAAVLNYCSIRHKNGSWVGCECVFTVVYDVLIASTTVYGRGHGSQKRAVDAPIVRQLFNSSPNDPRYHMLTWISNKFSQRLTEPLHEPRAAMFVNRFTRTATIMYATSGVSEILGLSPNALISQSFYYCIQEECLGDAVRCLEGAKRNDSIAYLRFWFRNPLQDVHGSGLGLEAAGAVPPIELEAVVSCTSDGLVVILRRARAPIPVAPAVPAVPAVPEPAPVYTNGIFAAPWAPEPVFSYGTPSYTPSHPAIMRPSRPEVTGTLCRDPAPRQAVHETPLPEQVSTMCRDDMDRSSGSASDSVYGSVSEQDKAGGPGETGPHSYRLMDTIRDVAVFAWGIVGINRGLEQYKCGTPTGNARPEDKMDLDDSR